MADPRWRLCDSNVEFFEHKTRCMGVFGVVDCKFDVRIANFKIADTRWRLFYSNFEVFEQLTQNMLYGYFLGR